MNMHRWFTRVLAAVASLGCVLLIASGPANASIGQFALVAKIGGLSGIENIAIDESTDDVYVYRPGSIEKFDSDGNPVNFAATGTNAITGVNVGGGDETELAVDNSAGPTKGDIYLAGGGVKIFGPDGSPLGALTEAPGVPWGETACGVAVDGVGNVYVGVYPSVVNKYTPTGGTVNNGDYVSSLRGLGEICNVAADSEGDLYVSRWGRGPIVRYNSQFGEARQVVANAEGRLAVTNSRSPELLVAVHAQLQQYDSGGNLLEAIGSEGAYYHSVAIDTKNDRLYAANYEDGDVEIWQGAPVPAVKTGPASDENPVGSATLSGDIDPEGASVESCSFQYGESTSYGSTVSCSQPTPLAGNADLPISALVSGVPLNRTFHYRLVATSEGGTTYGADQTFTIAVLPTVESLIPGVTLVTRDSAKLTGTVDPEGVDASYRFEYGTSESYEDSTQSGHTGVGSGGMAVSQQLGELLPETTYHYRLVATNVAGTTFGPDYTFTTGSAASPVAITGGSGAVAQNSAVITGLVDTNGLPTSYGFEIGTSTDYGPPTGLGTVGAGLSEVPVSLALTGLQPGTMYHYRLTATNIDGTSYGADETFTTGVYASTFVEPPPPLPFVAVPSIALPGESKPVVVKKSKSRGKKVKQRRKVRGKKKPKNKKKR
ncbi:MAG: hypothetical protein WB998_03385 [Solirubrobacteraceae bacterium]